MQELVRHRIWSASAARAAATAWPASGGGSASATSCARCAASKPAEDPISDPAGSALGHQVVRPLWLDLQEEMMQRLDALTIEELCSRAHRAGIEGRTAQGSDFEI